LLVVGPCAGTGFACGARFPAPCGSFVQAYLRRP